jgi:hypothetical protein
MTNVDALKSLYTALGGSSSEISNKKTATILQCLNAIAAALGSDSVATTNADAIANIADVAAAAIAPILQDRTVTPTTSEQTIQKTSDSYYGLGTVTVNAVTAAIDENIVAENIKSGVTILGVTGSYSG